MEMKLRPFPEWKEMLAAFSGAEYGALLTHEKVAASCGMKPQSDGYFRQVQKWRRAMRTEHRKHLRTVNGRGYLVVQPDDVREEARTYHRRAHRRMRVSLEILVTAPTDKMTPAEASRVALALGHAAGLLRTSGGFGRITTRLALDKQIAKRPDFPRLTK